MTSQTLEKGLGRELEGDQEVDASIFCPMCNKENAHDAVFCTNCNKALGDFRYVQEEFAASTHWHIRIADRITGLISRPHFIVAHLLWFGLWLLVNTGVFTVIRQFDQYPFNLLSVAIAVEAIFITGFILMSQNRQNEYANKRAELDYEVSVRTYRRLDEIETQLQFLTGQLAQLTSKGEGQHGAN